MIDIIHSPPNERELDELYAFLSVDDKGLRGIVAGLIPGIGAQPLITGSPTVLALMKRMAPKLAKETGKRIALYKFKRGEELESWNP
jgi:hypothetical protein